MTTVSATFGANPAPVQAQAAGLRAAFAVGAGFAIVAAILTLFLRRVEPYETDALIEGVVPVEVGKELVTPLAH